jgi:hypothetical protein
MYSRSCHLRLRVTICLSLYPLQVHRKLAALAQRSYTLGRFTQTMKVNQLCKYGFCKNAAVL